MENTLNFASEKEVRFGKLLKFIIPTYLTSLFNTVYTIIDGIFVSAYVGTNALAAINIVYQYLCCGSDDGIRKRIFFRLDHFFAFICSAASVPDRIAAEIRSNRRMACCSCGRSSDATRCSMVSTPDSTVEKRAVAYHNCSCYWWYKNLLQTENVVLS